VAVGVDQEGFREILGVAEGPKEDTESWRQFLTYLKGRGLTGVQLIISDKCLGLVEAATEFYPEARWQRCVVHWYRNIFSEVPPTKVKEVAAMLKAIHAQEDADSAQEKAMAVVEKLKTMKLKKAAEKVAESFGETLTYYHFPAEHHRQIRTNNMLERIMREIRRRTRVVGAFPDGRSALMLAAARRRHIAGSRWGARRYLDMNRLKEMETTAAAKTDNAAA
jgi:transposase-like protein